MHIAKMLILSERFTDGERRKRRRERAALMRSALSSKGFSAQILEYRGSGEILDAIAKNAPDIAWSLSQYSAGSRGRTDNVHALLEGSGTPYVGSGPDALELVRSKSNLKIMWRKKGVPTPDFIRLRLREDGLCDDLRGLSGAADFPYIVKPAKEGNSRGLSESSVARERDGLHRAVGEILYRYGECIIEEYLYRHPDAREFTVAMIGNGGGRLALPAELRRTAPGAARLITTEDKLGGGVAAEAVTDGSLARDLSSFALRAFEAAGVRDYARCDVILSGGKLNALEINGQPMVPDPWFDACAAGAGLDRKGYLGAIARAGMDRYRGEDGRKAAGE